MNNIHKEFMKKAIQLAENGMNSNDGGPFGAVIVKDNKIIAEGFNKVTSTNDPTAHAEVSAIRLACKNLDTYDLSDCIIYTSCEPCPMCLGAIYWSGLKKVYYGCTQTDAANIDFDDAFIYDEIKIDIQNRKIPFKQLLHKEAHEVFKQWTLKNDKEKY